LIYVGSFLFVNTEAQTAFKLQSHVQSTIFALHPNSAGVMAGRKATRFAFSPLTPSSKEDEDTIDNRWHK